MIEVKYPGKLYLMGEYAVLEPGNSALVMAVNRYLTLTIDTHDSYYVESEHGMLFGNEIYTSNKLSHVVAAINVVKEYLNQDLNTFSMKIMSELDSESGKKYGFGSSGVVVVAVLDGLLRFHGVELDKLTLFKLAVYTQFKMKEVSSGGDLAASIFGDTIRYTRYDLNNVRDSIACVHEDWSNLNIEYVDRDFNVLVAWSKDSHKSADSIDKVMLRKEEDSKGYWDLMTEAKSIVALDKIEEAISLYRAWMVKFGLWAHIEIETPVLKSFIETCETQGLAAKVSGAGGGDCALVYLKEELVDSVIFNLESSGMEVLEGAIVNAI